MAKAILIVDDSALIRKQMGNLLDKAGYDIGFAKNGAEAISFVQNFDFDLITMDINMPVMDGITAVKQIMKIKPTPILMVSSLTSEDAEITFEALDAGAVDFILKPGTITLKVEENEKDILNKVKSLAYLPKNSLRLKKQANVRKAKLTTTQNQNDIQITKKTTDIKKLVLVGSSTGGPGLIEEIVRSVPSNYPYPIVVVQHMPDNFTAGFAKRLDSYTDLEVIESKSGMTLHNGQIVIAYGGKHLVFGKKASGALILRHKEKNHRFFTPSVDEMFLSVIKVFDPKNILAVELTGIGDDGAQGMLELKKHGAYTIAEDETTAVVYGMPKSCWENGGAMKKIPFPKIVEEIIKYGKTN